MSEHLLTNKILVQQVAGKFYISVVQCFFQQLVVFLSTKGFLAASNVHIHVTLTTT